jgi:threonine/homoserine/homoserine lactone efflux protein
MPARFSWRTGTAPSSPLAGSCRAILLNLLNPKLTLFFFAFLPQFLDASRGPLDMSVIWLGAVFMIVTLAVFAVYACASAAVRNLVLAVPVLRQWIERSLGALLIGFAAKLAFTDQ